MSEFKKKYIEDFVLEEGGKVLRVKQAIPSLGNFDSDPQGTGTTVWEASKWLALSILRGEVDVANKWVIELGAGCGLCGLAAAQMGAASCMLTDLPHLQSQLEANVKLNDLKCRVESLDWAKPVDVFLNHAFPFSDLGETLIVGSDLLYREEDAAILGKTVLSIFNYFENVSGIFVFGHHNKIAISMFISELEPLWVDKSDLGELTRLNISKKNGKRKQNDDAGREPKHLRRASILPGMSAYEDAITAGFSDMALVSADSSDSHSFGADSSDSHSCEAAISESHSCEAASSDSHGTDTSDKDSSIANISHSASDSEFEKNHISE